MTSEDKKAFAINPDHQHKWEYGYDFQPQELRCFQCWSAAVYVHQRDVWVVSDLFGAVEEREQLPVVGLLNDQIRKTVIGILKYRVERTCKARTTKRIAKETRINSYIRHRVREELMALKRARVELGKFNDGNRAQGREAGGAGSEV